MSRMSELHAETERARSIRPIDIASVEVEIHSLLEAYPEIAEDDQLRADMLEGSTDLNRLLEILLSTYLDAAAMRNAIALRVKDLDTRAGRFERRQEGAKKTMQRLMEMAGVKKLPMTDATLYLAAVPPSVQIIDETAIPEEFFRIKREPNKSAINDALKNNVTIPGAYLGNGGVSLRVL